MKPIITLFTTQLPGNDSGTRVRNLYMLQDLKIEYDVHLICFLDDPVDENLFKRTVHENTQFYYLSKISPSMRIIELLSGNIPYVQRLKRYLSNERYKKLNISPETKICLFQELNSFLSWKNG